MDVETTFRHIFPFSALQCLLREILVQTKGSDYWQLIHCCRLVINGLFLGLEYPHGVVKTALESLRMHERKWSARRMIGLFFQKVMSPGLSRNIKSFLLCFSEADGDRKSSMACVPIGSQGLKNKQELSPYASFKNHYYLLVKGTSLRLPLLFKRPLV